MVAPPTMRMKRTDLPKALQVAADDVAVAVAVAVELAVNVAGSVSVESDKTSLLLKMRE